MEQEAVTVGCMAAELTLGAEEELHLVDLASGELSARAPQLLSRLPGSSYSAEIQRTTVETNTDVVTSLSDLREELLRLRKELVAVAGEEGLGVAAVGTAGTIMTRPGLVRRSGGPAPPVGRQGLPWQVRVAAAVSWPSGGGRSGDRVPRPSRTRPGDRGRAPPCVPPVDGRASWSRGCGSPTRRDGNETETSATAR